MCVKFGQKITNRLGKNVRKPQGVGGGLTPTVYYKDLANIFRTLPGPGEFSELAPPLHVWDRIITRL